MTDLQKFKHLLDEVGVEYINGTSEFTGRIFMRICGKYIADDEHRLAFAFDPDGKFISFICKDKY